MLISPQMTKKTTTLIDFWTPSQLTSNSKKKSCNKPWITKGLLTSIAVKIKFHERMIKTKDPFKKIELIRINKAKHCNKYVLENKSDLWDGMEWENIGWNPRNYHPKQKVI